VTFDLDLDLEHILDAGSSVVEVVICAKFTDGQTDRQTDRQTDDGRLVIAQAHGMS